LRSITPTLDMACELSIERQGKGFLPPCFLIHDTIQEVEAFIAVPPTENIIYDAFFRKSQAVPGLSTSLRLQLLRSIEKELQDRTYPAYRAVRDTLIKLTKQAGNDPGLWRLPDGAAYYEFLLNGATTTAMSPAEIHQLGLTETEKLQTKIIRACRDLEDGIETIGDCFEIMSDASGEPIKDNQSARRCIVGKVKTLIADTERHMPNLFHHLPTSPVTVKPIPAFLEANRNQIYQPPSLDGSRAGLFELNVGQLLGSRDIDNELRTLVYHEIFPGHHLQMTLAIESEQLPLFQRIITYDAYIEGWAKYAEILPWSHGLVSDPRWHISRMLRELISTVNLVVDTGIHFKRWSVEQAMEYLLTQVDVSPEFAKYLVHRSASAPAQLCSYKIGLIKMLELRQRMSSALGDHFDVRDFHDVVLRNGAVPLRLLERIVEAEIADRMPSG